MAALKQLAVGSLAHIVADSRAAGVALGAALAWMAPPNPKLVQQVLGRGLFAQQVAPLVG